MSRKGSLSLSRPRSMKNRMLLFDSSSPPLLRLNNPRVIRAWNLQIPHGNLYISISRKYYYFVVKLFFHYPTENIHFLVYKLER